MCFPDSKECDAENDNNGCKDSQQCERQGGRGFRCVAKKCAADSYCPAGFKCIGEGRAPKRCQDASQITTAAPTTMGPQTTRDPNQKTECDQLNAGKGCATHEQCRKAF